VAAAEDDRGAALLIAEALEADGALVLRPQELQLALDLRQQTADDLVVRRCLDL
jgi:hypothetical protein